MDILGKNAMDVASTTARFLESNIEPYKELVEAEDYEEGNFDREYYEKMNKTFNMIKEKTGVSFIYTIKKISDKDMAFILDGEDPESEDFSPIGAIDELSEDEARAYEEKKTFKTDMVYFPQWGTFLTGYSPIIHHESEEMIGAVGVDYSDDYVKNLLSRIRWSIIVTMFILDIMLILVIYKIMDSKFEEAEKDYLTGLFTKRFFDNTLSKVIKDCKEKGNSLSLIMVDVDNFKDINDNMGHVVGDKILQYIANMIKISTRDSDFCSRYGGDEFIIILPNTDIAKASFIGERIRRSIEVSKKNAEDMNITISMGVTEFHKDMTVEEFIRKADEAMYVSKTGGRNRITTLMAKF
jgi:diguanylate cyclase (GGDEF)-like protein